MKNHGNTLVILLIITIFLAINNNGRQPSALASGNTVQSNWSTAEKVSGDATHAEKPIVTSSPNGNTVLVAYSGKSSGSENQDPYYSYSNKNGESGSWVQHKIVAPSTADLSEHVDAAFDERGYAHLTWREGSGLAYAYSISTNMALGFKKPTSFFDIPVTSNILNPNVATYGSLVHIIWVENINNRATEIYHNYSDDYGASWQNYSDENKLTHFGEIFLPESPAVQVDDDGNLHVVYQQLNLFQYNRILYTKGDVSYNTSEGKYEFDWFAYDKEVEISHMLNFEIDFDIVDPDITYQNGRIDVSATLKFIDQVTYPGNYVYHFYCTSRCDVENNWKTSGVISGSPLKVNQTPENITSSIVSAGGCPIVTYDGVDSSNNYDYEQLRNVGKCQSWKNWSYLTPDNIRAFRPSTEMQENNWWFYVTYQTYVTGSEDEVHFMRSKPETTVFLPIILKK